METEHSHTPSPLLLLDFDGTVCLSDAPIWAYAEEGFDRLAASPAAGTNTAELIAQLRDTLATFLDAKLGPRWPDGYLAVKELLAPHLDEPALHSAFVASRARLQAGEVQVSAPEGLKNFLREIAPYAKRILVTNAPLDGVSGTLDHLGLTAEFDQIITDARKPEGWQRIVPQLLAEEAGASKTANQLNTDRLRGDQLISVGDFYGNDLAPLIPFGARTALINRFGATGFDPAPTWSAPTFPELYAPLREALTAR